MALKVKAVEKLQTVGTYKGEYRYVTALTTTSCMGYGPLAF